MKLSIIFLLLMSTSIVSNAQHPDTLTNEKIIKLYKAGFSKDILKSKIQTSPASYDVSIDGMLDMKKAGVPDEIINLLIANPNSVTDNSSAATSSTSFPPNGVDAKLFNLPSGIYFKNTSGEFVEIEPSVLTSSKSGRAAQYFISPLINAKTKATLSGKQSSSVIFETIPKFYFVFDTTFRSNLNSENSVWFGSARSPKEFLLVKLDVNKNSREITVGKENLTNSTSGIDDKLIVHFQSTKLSKGIYEITPEFLSPRSEYCFMFSEGIKHGESSKVFDFSVRQPKGF